MGYHSGCHLFSMGFCLGLVDIRPGGEKAYLGQSGRGVKLTTHINVLPRLKMMALCLHPLIHLHGVVLN
jgi:hypothetical protein